MMGSKDAKQEEVELKTEQKAMSDGSTVVVRSKVGGTVLSWMRKVINAAMIRAREMKQVEKIAISFFLLRRANKVASSWGRRSAPIFFVDSIARLGFLKP